MSIDPPRLGMTFHSHAVFKQAQHTWWHSDGPALYNVWYDVTNDYEILDYIAYCRVCRRSVWAKREEVCDGPEEPPSYPNIGMTCECGILANAGATD
ncbi:hypothetical protein QKT49_gp114 [Acanthamoeba castellanii medusavirus]|uniref:Uncharacterized protein n=1 Tax=Acanthamoeba castellanii medusavirus J1 TaxID=3114988 RepID=A0A3T1CWQ8_9VIRU|nr:hypothetical protein QKT49_gp114 [Acanthamoeba castellanii medusavirus]BBI30254.1 hypothetical protein [Acanthamoeba castellanii medusavirus J1]